MVPSLELDEHLFDNSVQLNISEMLLSPAGQRQNMSEIATPLPQYEGPSNAELQQ